MSRSKATKRRKVWVDEWDDVSTTKQRGYAPFVERLPGDVVLSREDVARAMALLDEVGGAYSDGQEKHAIRTLLRGRR